MYIPSSNLKVIRITLQEYAWEACTDCRHSVHSELACKTYQYTYTCIANKSPRCIYSLCTLSSLFEYADADNKEDGEDNYYTVDRLDPSASADDVLYSGL